MKNMFMIIIAIIMFIAPIENTFAQVSDNNDEYLIQNILRNEVGNKVDLNNLDENLIIPFYPGESFVDAIWETTKELSKFVARLAVEFTKRSFKITVNLITDVLDIVISIMTGEFKQAFSQIGDLAVGLTCTAIAEPLLMIYNASLDTDDIVTIDDKTKEFLKRYNYLYGKLDLDGGVLLQTDSNLGDIIVHRDNPLHADGSAITLYNHILFENESHIPRAKTYSLSGDYYDKSYAINWYIKNEEYIKDRITYLNGYLGEQVFPIDTSSLSSIDKANIYNILDIVYEVNISIFLHELVHIAQYANDYNSQADFTCHYLSEVIENGYANAEQEANAYKAQTLFFSDFAKRTARLTYLFNQNIGKVSNKHIWADQDGIVACVPSYYKNDTWCNSLSSCDHLTLDFISCNMWNTCTIQLLQEVGISPYNAVVTTAELESLSKNELEKFFSACYFVDNCPSKYNPSQNPSDINFIGSACYDTAQENFCINKEEKTIIMPARDVDGDCRINGLKNERFSTVEVRDPSTGAIEKINITYDNGIKYFKDAVEEIESLNLKQSGEKSWETMYCLLSENYGNSSYDYKKSAELKAGFAFYSMMLNYDSEYRYTILGAMNCVPREYNNPEILKMIDSWDNCFYKKNFQSDLDGDGFGDSCDYDIDGDGSDNRYEVKNNSNPFYSYDKLIDDYDRDGVFDSYNYLQTNEERCLDMCKKSFSASRNHNTSFYNASISVSQYLDWFNSEDWKSTYGLNGYLDDFKINTGHLNVDNFCEYTCSYNKIDNCDHIANTIETVFPSPMFTAEADENGIGGALNMSKTKTASMQYDYGVLWQADHDLDGVGDLCDSYWKFMDYSVDKAFYVDVVIPDSTYEEKTGPLTLKHYDVKHDSYKVFLLSLIGADTDKYLINTSMYFCYCETGNCEKDCSKDYNHASDSNFLRWNKMTPANIDAGTLGIIEYEVDDSDYRGQNESIYTWDWRKDLESWYLSKNIIKTIDLCETRYCPEYKFVVSVGVNNKYERFTKVIDNVVKRNPSYFYNDWRQLGKEGKEFSTAKFANAVRSTEFSISYEKKHVIKTIAVDSYEYVNTDIKIEDGIIVGGEVITEDKIIQNPTETKIITSGVNLSQPIIAKPVIKF